MDSRVRGSDGFSAFYEIINIYCPLPSVQAFEISCELNPPPPQKRDFRLAVDPEKFYRSGEKRIVASYMRDGQRTEAFLLFRGSRSGFFNDLSARETYPLHCSPRLRSGPGIPPQISHEKTASSRQSQQKSICPLSPPLGGYLRLPPIREETH
jgi:hypothetical protein